MVCLCPQNIVPMSQEESVLVIVLLLSLSLPSRRQVRNERLKIVHMLADVLLHLAASLFQRKRGSHSGN